MSVLSWLVLVDRGNFILIANASGRCHAKSCDISVTGLTVAVWSNVRRRLTGRIERGGRGCEVGSRRYFDIKTAAKIVGEVTYTMKHPDSLVTIHMAASLDGFIARKDGQVDWMETSDEFAGGETMDPDFVEAFLMTIDCYVMGSRTYETALAFEGKGFGWSYGDKPVFVLTSRELRRTRETVEFYSGELAQFVDERLRPRFRSIWFVGGGAVSGECLRLGLADEVRYSILPVLIGDGIPFFDRLEKDVALHLVEVKAYQSGTVALRYEVRESPSE